MTVIGELLSWALAGVSSILAGVGGVVYRNRERSVRNEHRLEGGPMNPNDEGLMDIAYETREAVKHLEERMDKEHREVMAKLESIEDGRFEDETRD